MRRHTDASFHGGIRARASTVTGLVAALTLALSACGTGTGNGTDTAEPVESTTTVTTAPETTTPEEQDTATTPPPAGTTTATGTTAGETNSPAGYLGDPDTAPKEKWPEGVPELMVSNVRIASHEGFDRVVFDLAGEGDPGWFTHYTTTPAQQGSGHPVPYEGSTALMVGIHGTPYPFDLDMEFPDHGTYPGAGNVTEAIYTSLFEARTEFVIGLAEELPYSVTVLEEPKRLVIDFLAQ